MSFICGVVEIYSLFSLSQPYTLDIFQTENTYKGGTILMTSNDRCSLEPLMFNQMAVHILVFMASAVMMLIF